MSPYKYPARQLELLKRRVHNLQLTSASGLLDWKWPVLVSVSIPIFHIKPTPTQQWPCMNRKQTCIENVDKQIFFPKNISVLAYQAPGFTP